MTKLSEEELAAALGRLAGWQQDRNAIRRVYEFADFGEALRFVKRVADLAEAADHHPDILIHYRQVTLTLWSHDVGAVTGRDLDLARKIDG
jgi:4a-hydroxytetrahydrobiopterin dehydratase